MAIQQRRDQRRSGLGLAGNETGALIEWERFHR
jgi:hypothetical protein